MTATTPNLIRSELCEVQLHELYSRQATTRGIEMDKAFEECGVSPVELAQARRYGMSIDWSQEDEAFLVSFPDVPGVMTHGATREEAAERGEEVIVMWLTAMIDAGRPVPQPSVNAKNVSV